MTQIKAITRSSSNYPEVLQHIHTPPSQLRYIGDFDTLLSMPRLAIVGSRKVTPYGKAVTLSLARQAAERGIAIISGLALGVDGLAHQGALEAKGVTAAVLPSGLQAIYPASHKQLAEQIVASGGALLTEYPDSMQPFKTNFIERNRLVSGLSDAVLITEAAIKSGTLHTAKFALEQGRTVMAVPGNITSEQSGGTNNLIKAGAIAVTEISDILAAMGLTETIQPRDIIGSTQEETILLTLLTSGMSEGSELLAASKLSASAFNQSLTMLEITGKIRPLGAGHWGIV